MKKLILLGLALILLLSFVGCESASKTEPAAEGLAGRYKTAAEWNGGLAFLADDREGPTLYFAKGGETDVLCAGPCLPPLCADGDRLYFTRMVEADSVWRAELHTCDRTGGERTLDCVLDDVFLVTDGVVHGRLDGCYVRVPLNGDSIEKVCEIPDGYDPRFYADGSFYATLLGRNDLALCRLGDSFERTELSPGLQFAADGWGYGMNDEGRMRVRLADGSVERLPLQEEPLCGAGDRVFFFSEGKVWLRQGDGEPEELFSAPVSLQLGSTLPGPEFQLCGDSLFFYTLSKIRLAEGAAAVRLSLSGEAVRYYYRYDLSARTLELLLESGGPSEG